jgi:pyruvate dehydrogenase (quinone)
VEDPRDVRDTLAKGLADPGPVLMEFVTDPNALSIPPAITGEQIRGFATSATKQVLGGGVGKMIDLARSNLRNIPRP